MKNREIELKYVTNLSFEATSRALGHMVPYPIETFKGIGTDYIWDLSGRCPNVDLLRVRDNNSGGGEMTTKKKDRGSNFDRMEKNIEVDDPKQAVNLLTDIHGAPNYVFSKEIVVLCDEDDPDLVISAYRILGRDGTFIEVESPEAYDVQAFGAKVLDVFSRLGAKIRQEPRSLLELFQDEGGPGESKVGSNVTKIPLRRRT